VLGNFRDQCVSQHSPSQHIRLCGVVRVSLSLHQQRGRRDRLSEPARHPAWRVYGAV